MPVVPHFSPVLRTPLPGLFLTRALLGALLKLAVVRSQRTKSFQNPKVLNASEDAHLKIMSTFETDEHLHGAASQLLLARTDEKRNAAGGP